MTAIFAHAWWSAFVFASGAPLGALALRLIGRLTGGRWASAEPLARLSALTPWLGLLVLPGILLTPWTFPTPPPGPAAAYLAAPAHIARTALALIGWSLIAVGMNRVRGRLFAALALVFHGVAVSLVSVDWIMTIAPGWISSAGGMTLADQQFALALAVTLVSLGEAGQALRKDIAGLLTAMLLANLYFALMTYVVPWYGDLPGKTLWFRQRADAPWQALLAAGLTVGSIAPLILLALGRRRPAVVRFAGFAACAGLALQAIWWSAPAPGELSLPLATLLVAAAGAGLVVLAGGWRPDAGERLAHAR
ncbi:MAG TPA: hypothetical protein VGL73_02720 [Caulobacteraceae bacterium]|jgi:hypothetical protein